MESSTLPGLESLERGVPARPRLPRLSRQPRAADESAITLWADDAELIALEALRLQALESEQALESYRPMLEEIGVTLAAELAGYSNNIEVLVAGRRVPTLTPPTRGGKRGTVISVDDGTGSADATISAEAQGRIGSALRGADLVLIAGTTTREGGAGVTLRASNAWDLERLWLDWVKRGAQEY